MEGSKRDWWGCGRGGVKWWGVDDGADVEGYAVWSGVGFRGDVLVVGGWERVGEVVVLGVWMRGIGYIGDDKV